MNNSSAIFWKDELVGHVSDLSNDMWYYDGRWACADSVNARDFETLARDLDPAHVREVPEDGLLVQVAFDQLKRVLEPIVTKQRAVIFFDELPWILTQKSNFLGIVRSFLESLGFEAS